MFVKNAISIFVGMQIKSVLSTTTNFPIAFKSPNLLFKPYVKEENVCFNFSVKTFPKSNDIRFDYQIESIRDELNRTLTYTSLRRKPLPD